MVDWQPTDPFILLRKEVERALTGVNQLYSIWENPKDSDEQSWAANEVKGSIEAMEWDLQDLETAVEVAKQDYEKFNISPQEIENRIQFISTTRNHLKKLTKNVSSPTANAQTTKQNRQQLGIEDRNKSRYDALNKDIQSNHKQFVNSHQQMQQNMYTDQEKGLKEVSIAVDVLHDMGHEMTDELNRQAGDLEEFEEEITTTSARVSKAIRKVDDLITKVDSKAGYWIIAALIIALIILFVVFFLV